ncbi:Metal-pseudopaline receptor CntO [Vibrio stylophorae]|uniref:Metal-pseudopaline receptor CntO n=1 Tax=Vibrio stylophorae TaxID=659351 RepID=A0ABM8ZXE5_9VIBR|nr:TonB-dependent receptor [Vibrio stylophorae]CAH0535424.1 Metal-pseudopaline receptor CntO [Vibrio stylophorae]
MFKKHPLSALLSLLLVTPEGHVFANEHDAVVVTGQTTKYVSENQTSMRMDAAPLETPNQVTVIDHAVIEEQRAMTLGDVLKNDSSISNDSYQRNRQAFTLRGFPLGSDSGFLRDGKQHWSHYRQPIEILESVEVLKGPAGLLYGKSSPAGLVNMVTKKPTAETQVQVSQDVGQNNLSRTIVDVSGALNDDQSLRGRAIVSKHHEENWRKYADGQSANTDRFVGALMLEYDLNENVTVSAHYDKTDDRGNVDSGSPLDANGDPIWRDKILDASWSEIHNVVENYGLGLRASLPANWSLNTGYNFQDFNRRDTESFYKLNADSQATGIYQTMGYDRKDNWQFQTAFADFTNDFDALGVNHQVLIGANWLNYYYHRQDAKTAYTDTQLGQPIAKPNVHYSTGKIREYERDSYGIYAQNLMTLTPAWQVLAGVRVDYEDEQTKGREYHQTHVLPKAAVIYHPAENGSIYLTYSESFQPQSPVDDVTDLNNGKALDPVKGELYEIGSKWELMDNRLLLSGSVFQITEKNSKIVEDYTCTTPGCTIDQKTTQAGKREHKGVEFAATGQITDAFSVFGSATYLDAEYVKTEDPALEGKRPTDVPEWSASIWTGYDFMQGTMVNVGAIYVGERFADDANTIRKDAYIRFDLALSHHLRYDQDLDIYMQATVENLFDVDYLGGTGGHGSNAAGASGTEVGAPRQFLATLQLKY